MMLFISDHLCNDIPQISSFPAQGTALQKMIYRRRPDTPAARGSALDRKQETEQFTFSVQIISNINHYMLLNTQLYILK